MKCKKMRVCNICEATFKAERGCILEKRCHACRFLAIQKQDTINGVIYVPQEVVNTYRRIQNEHTAEEIGISEHKYEAVKLHIGNYDDSISLYSLNEFDEPSYEHLFNEYEGIIEEMLLPLKNSQQIAIKSRFSDELTLEETAEILGVSRERARQIELVAIKTLNHPSIGKKYKKMYIGE